MQLRINTYIDGDSFVHTCDARVKVLLLCAYTATVFWVETWAGMTQIFNEEDKLIPVTVIQ
ncbi:hypothetical protein, partial [Senegalimassilia anaerobia]